MKILSLTTILGLSVAMLATCLLQAKTSAGTFHWGDFNGPNVMYLDVTENNNEATSLFAPEPGMGGPILIGDSLHLDPQNFASMSQNGEADLIDSTLSTVIMASPGNALQDISISELGDYSLGGLIGSNASAQVGAAFFWTVLEVDHAAVNLATQATNLILGTGGGPNGGVYTRPSDDGTAVIWSGNASIDLDAYLASEQINGSVTKVRLTFDNTLQTSAELGSTAFIKKKSIDIDVTPKVPEPATALLLGMAIVLTSTSRRR